MLLKPVNTNAAFKSVCLQEASVVFYNSISICFSLSKMDLIINYRLRLDQKKLFRSKAVFLRLSFNIMASKFDQMFCLCAKKNHKPCYHKHFSV